MILFLAISYIISFAIAPLAYRMSNPPSVIKLHTEFVGKFNKGISAWAFFTKSNHLIDIKLAHLHPQTKQFEFKSISALFKYKHSSFLTSLITSNRYLMIYLHIFYQEKKSHQWICENSTLPKNIRNYFFNITYHTKRNTSKIDGFLNNEIFFKEIYNSSTNLILKKFNYEGNDIELFSFICK